ncbi:MAG: CBS domain-containing protein [Chloroflexi bacterium]|nr:CBS domain-containing protein [Chloroflexota bacterium]
MSKVREHMETNLVLASPGDSLVELSRSLNSHRAAATPIVDDGNLVGILTERDVVRAVAVGADLETSSAADFMSRLLTTVGPEQEMGVAAELMIRQRIRHLPVVDQGRLVGLLSLREVVRWSLRELGHDEGHHLAQLGDFSA